MYTYAEYASLYIETKNIRPTAKQQIINCQRRYVLVHLGHLPLDEITPELILQVPEKMRSNGRAKRTIRITCHQIHRIFAYAVENSLIPSNPCALLFKWNPNQKCEYLTNLEDHNRIINAINRLPLKNLYGFCYTTGLSFIQVRDLRNCDVHLESRTFSIKSGRNKGSVKIPDQALPFVKSQAEYNAGIGETEGDLFFVSEKGRHISNADRNISTRILRSLLNRPGFELRDLWRAYSVMLEITEGRKYDDYNLQHNP